MKKVMMRGLFISLLMVMALFEECPEGRCPGGQCGPSGCATRSHE